MPAMKLPLLRIFNSSSVTSTTMPRIPVNTLSRIQPARTFVSTQRLLSSTSEKNTGTQNSRPGWEGRPADDHVVKRPELDVQAEASHSGMRKKGEEGSQGLSQKDERDSNKRAKEDHPEAPEPVIGMNSERGQKGH